MTPEAENWDGVAAWWVNEVEDDPVYREDVGPIFDRLMEGSRQPVMELGCGEGQWLRRLDPSVTAFGTDLSERLLRHARRTTPVALGRMPDLGWLGDGVLGTAVSLFVLDLIGDHRRFFAETARVVRPGGTLAVVINHPVFTAPGSGPFMDPDLDVFWRWGNYLENGASDVPADDGFITMYHRPAATLLTSAAGAGWCLEVMVEAPLGPDAIEREPSYAGQESIPRFLGLRWRRSDRNDTR